MDKNSVIGFVLMGAVLVGFTAIQNNKYKKAAEQQAQLDSIARVEYMEQVALDSLRVLQSPDSSLENSVLAAAEQRLKSAIYKDSLLNVASLGEETFSKLENDYLELTLTSKGAQPFSARVKDFYNYDSTDLYVFRPGQSSYAISVYAGEYLNTADFSFVLAERTDSSVTYRLPFAQGGYIEQKYVLPKDSYMVHNYLSFVGMNSVMPRNVSSFDVDINMLIPRMERGYKNESQYSKLDYYFDGEKKPAELGRGRSGSKKIDTSLNWFAFQQQFFSAIVSAPQQFASGNLAVTFFPQEDPDRNLMACEAKMRANLNRESADVTVPFDFYFGPNHYNTLKSYERKFEKIIPLGGNLVGWFTKFVIIPLFNFLHKYFSNFGIIILLMTIIIKIVVLPLTSKSFLSSAKMQALKPELEKINAKYPKQEDAMKKQQATMDLYKRAGVNTMGGCLPTLLTFPILWAMFRFFPASIELRQQPFLWAKDLSTYDSIIDFGSKVPLIGDHLSLFALLMAVVMWLYSKMTMSNQAAANDPSAASMKFMSVWMMPIMMFFICNNLSAALSYYYLLSQLFAIVQAWVIKKFFVHPEEILAKLKATEGKPLPKSKFQLRLEEAQRIQQQQLKEQQKKRGY